MGLSDKVLIIRILLFRVLYQGPLSSETPIQVVQVCSKCDLQGFQGLACGF